MKTLIYDVFEENNSLDNNHTFKLQKMSSCRGWSKITLNRIYKMSSCRGWSKITLNRI